ncbi:MAG: rhodanese-like domain-containing protein [Planctomycetota bacterium]
MHLEQIYLACLSQASYLIVDEKTKTAVVVDPRRDVAVYLEKAERLGARIRHVLLTHLHADFLAGHLELRERAGATIHLGAKGQAEYDFQPMQDGGVLEFGDVRLEFLETPGHTPESVSIVVYDLARSRTKPQAVLTGDTLFIGDVGRPDLLVGVGMKAEDMAGMLYESLHGKLLKLPDETLLYPGHGAGSACGKNLSAETSSTLGDQRRTNYALQPMAKAAFVRILTGAQPDAPAYFAHDAVLNRADRPTLEEILVQALKPLPLDEVLRLANGGAQLLDTRGADAFAAEHLAGAVNIGLSGRFASWVGTVFDPKSTIVLISDPGKEEESAVRLGRIGYDRIAGCLQGGMNAAADRPELLVRSVRVEREGLAKALSGSKPPQVVDVRLDGEWEAGHIEGALHLPLASLTQRIAELPADRDLVIVCKSGYRSSIAASLIERAGFPRVTDLRGGMDAWLQGAQPVTAGR